MRYVGLRAADLVQEVVGLVSGEEGVGQHQQEPVGERPGEVGARAWVEVEGTEQFPDRPGRLVRRVEPAIRQSDREEQDEEPTDRARSQEHQEPVPGEQLDQIGRGH